LARCLSNYTYIYMYIYICIYIYIYVYLHIYIYEFKGVLWQDVWVIRAMYHGISSEGGMMEFTNIDRTTVIPEGLGKYPTGIYIYIYINIYVSKCMCICTYIY
jgi:hypothetical protein